MKSTCLLSTVAALLCGVSSLAAQVAVEKVPDPVPAPANTVTPAPAVPVAPTPGGERRAVRREERRIDRNDPNGTLAPAVQPNGTVTAAPNAAAGARTAIPAAPENWRYRNQNGQWWYYTPSNSWMIWNGNAWGPYTPGGDVVAPAVPSNGAYTTYYRAPNQTNYGRSYRRGWFGRRYYY